MIRGKKYFNKDVVYVSLTKHFCSICGEKLRTVKVSKVVNFNSPEAEKYDFSFGGARKYDMIVDGDVKFIWKEFECPNCKKHFTIDEMKILEGYNIDESNFEELSTSNKKKRDLLIFYIICILIAIITGIVRNIFLKQ